MQNVIFKKMYIYQQTLIFSGKTQYWLEFRNCLVNCKKKRVPVTMLSGRS
jgi:hypothetical protein